MFSAEMHLVPRDKGPKSIPNQRDDAMHIRVLSYIDKAQSDSSKTYLDRAADC